MEGGESGKTGKWETSHLRHPNIRLGEKNFHEEDREGLLYYIRKRVTLVFQENNDFITPGKGLF